MALSSALPVLERPETAPTPIAPATVPAAPTAEAASVEAASVEAASVEAASVEAASVEAASVEAVSVEAASVGIVGSAAGRRARRIPQPPGRRGHLWLAALVSGALLAGTPTVLGSGPQAVTADASDYGLGIASDVGITGGTDETDVRRGITEAEAQARLGELAASRAAREPKTASPMTDFRLTTCFCMRWGQMHYGLDLAAPLGTPIYSAADGVVIRAGSASGFGNAVYIQDADGNVHIYGHMRYYDVAAGDIVHAGDEIAQVGNEGYSTGPHLHYEIHRGGEDGRPIDPQEWLAERGVQL